MMLKRIFRRKTTKDSEAMNNLGAGKILKDATDIDESNANGSGMSTDQYDDGSGDSKQN